MIQYNPNGIFEQNPNKGGVCEVKDVYVLLTAATNNQTVIAAVSGKKIVVLHGTILSVGAAGTILFKSASGGTNKKAYTVPANTVATPNVEISPTPWGAFRTNTGEGLFADTTGAANIGVGITYIEVTP